MQLLSTILKVKKVKIRNVDEGSIMIKEALSLKRVLLVLDDVAREDQLKAVLAMRDWIKQGSKIIITSRDEKLLKAFKLNEIHRVEELDYDKSLQLFSWHAFGQGRPIEAFMVHSKRVVEYCGGLPLALEVLGSSLYGEEVDVWECAIRKLKDIPKREIIEKLKISFDSLEDDCDKNLFLDIACFFVGKNKDFVITVLDACKLHQKIGINNLVKRCLLSVDESNKLKMHRLLQEMGREIIRRKSPMDPEERSRLWHHEDALNVLREKNGTKSIEGLILNLHGSTLSEELGKGFSSNEANLETHAFSRMCNLRLLWLNNARLIGDYEEFPKKLRLLCWCGFSLKIIPTEFPLENLVVLKMKYSSLKHVWKGEKMLKSLKILNLSHSHGLTNTPNFSKLPNLERLILKDCINLMEVDKSIGELERLVLLNLKDCKNLKNLPTNIGQLKALEKFILSGCSKLDKLPKQLCEMECSKVFDAGGATISQLASTSSDIISRLSRWFFGPRKSPESISFSLPRSLVSLSVANCNLSDDAIPRDLGRLSLLQELNLNGNPICSLPESIKGLTMLQSLWLFDCTRLQFLPELPMSLQVLDACDCRSLEILTILPNMWRSLDVYAHGCKKLVEVKKLFRLEPIGNIDAEMIKNLELVELESMENNVEVKLYNSMTLEVMIGPIQGLYEFGIFTIFHPWNEVPQWFSNKSTKSWIHLNVPNLKIRGLNVCVVYANTYPPFYEDKLWFPCVMRIFNKTKDVDWKYLPTFVGIPDERKNMRWSSHWKIENQLEAGDEVLVEVTLWTRFTMKEIGVHIVYDEEKDTNHNTHGSCSGGVIDAVDFSSITNLPNLPNLLKSPYSYVYVYGCKKLDEVKKLLRLEPIGNIDAEMIKNLELVDLESIENVEVKLFNNMTHEEMIGPIQGLNELGIFSIFHPWNEVPPWFSNKSTKSWIHLNVPSFPNLKIRGLNVCVVYAHPHTPVNKDGFFRIWIMRIFNMTKDVEWNYFPTFIGIPDERKNMRWSSHWKIENQLEAGDQVDVSVSWSTRFKVKEFGVHIVYEEEEKDTNHNTNGSCPGDVTDAVDLSSYEDTDRFRFSRRTYCLNHSDFINSLSAQTYINLNSD